MRNNLFPFQGHRLLFFTVAMIASLIVLGARLYEWQFLNAKDFNNRSDENSVQKVPLPASRGLIYDRYGTQLAINVPAFNVEVIPASLPDDQNKALDVLNRLSALIDVPATRAAADAAGKKDIRSLDELIKEGQGIAPYRPVVVKTDIDQAIAQDILEDNTNLPGVVVDIGAVRDYPTGSTTAQVIGYLGPIGATEAEQLRAQGYNPAFERVGYSGIEAYLDTELAGKRGIETRVVDVAGLPVRTISRDEPVAGQSVRLSIDLQLQSWVQQAVVDQINAINLKQARTVTQSGVVIAENPQTGEILAMVSWPTYDNTQFAREINADYYLRELNDPQKPLINHAISALYPPGSTWKILTATGVAEEKVIDPHAYLFDSGQLFVQNSFAKFDISSQQRFVCWLRTGHGQVDLIHAIAWSCDIYFYQVGGGNPDPKYTNVLTPGGLGIDNLDRYGMMYGIGTRLGVELPGEAAGRMPDRDWKRRLYGESWSTGDTYNAAFGQGYVTLSPLQLINAASSIANGGKLYHPTLVNSYVDSEGNVLQPFKPTVERTILYPTDGSPAVLNAREDMIIQGKNSLSCVCDPETPYDDPTQTQYYDAHMPKCSDDFIKNYKASVRADRDPNPYDDVHDYRDTPYVVTVNQHYSFDYMCAPLLFNPDYQPPFVDPINIQYVQQGMRGATTFPGGTSLALQKVLGYVKTAGKTGTAEYCDDIANKQNLCVPGQWPSHAWFVGYAPYDNPEIAVVAFIYNGGEGSANALPVVSRVLDCYFTLKGEREQGSGSISPCQEKPQYLGK